MSKPNQVIEQMKNAILVVLFLSTVLLLYFFWGNVSFDKISLPEDRIALEIPSAQEVIKPYDIIVNFGAENYTIIPLSNRDIWNSNKSGINSIIKEFHKFGQTENIKFEEITTQQYEEAMKFQSLQAKFAYHMPFSEFCRIYDINLPQSANMIAYLSTVGYSSVSPDSLFIYNGRDHKYYRLVADSGNMDFSSLIASLESEGYNTYYPISSYLGIENSTLVPLDVQTNLQSFSIQRDAYSYQKEKINAFAETFFGESFDFVRKITEENGTIIYMYGYGQKVLIVKPDGTFEYKEEQLNGAGSQQSFAEALDTALEFVASHGTWESLDGAELPAYLKDLTIDPDKKKGYRFTFGMEANGIRLFNKNGESLIVDVTQGQVTYYYRNMLDYDPQELESITAASNDSAFSAVNLIAQNYEYIYQVLKEKGLETDLSDKNKQFEKVSSLISNMEIGYLNSDANTEEESKVKPVWVVALSGINLYFDLYSAEPIGYSEE